MLNLFQRYVVVSIAASLLGCAAAPVSSSDTDRRLSDALDQALPALVSSGDYRSASKLSFQLASARSRMNETAAACSALSQSLAYYRTALSKERSMQLAFELGVPVLPTERCASASEVAEVSQRLAPRGEVVFKGEGGAQGRKDTTRRPDPSFPPIPVLRPT